MFAPLEDVSNYEITFVSIAFPQGAAQFVSTHCINIFSIPFFVSLSLKEITIFEEKLGENDLLDLSPTILSSLVTD